MAYIRWCKHLKYFLFSMLYLVLESALWSRDVKLPQLAAMHTCRKIIRYQAVISADGQARNWLLTLELVIDRVQNKRKSLLFLPYLFTTINDTCFN